MRIGPKRTNIVLSVPPSKIILMMNPALVRWIDEYILMRMSTIMNAIIVTGAPFMSARAPQAILHTAELTILIMRPRLMRWSSCKNDM